MKILRLALVTAKRMFRDLGTLSMMLIMPLVVILGVGLLSGKGNKNIDVNVAFDVQDKGSYSKELLEKLNIKDNVFYNEPTKAMELLEKNEVISLYVIPENFTEKITNGEKPEIKALKREAGNATLVTEITLSDSINKKIKEVILVNAKVITSDKELYLDSLKTAIVKDKKSSAISKEAFAPILLLIYFIILSSNSIGTELLNLKKEKVLTRAITTGNKSYEIIGSIFLAMFLLQTVVSFLVLFISKLILKFPLANIHIIFINIILAILVSISLGLFITRLFKNQVVASYVLILICIATFFLGLLAIAGDNIREIPWVLINLAKFAPQYWLLDSIYNGKLFPNVFALILMVVVMFTAGNLNLRNFVNTD
jgi:ABC-2 type transport system permease protein